MKRPTPILAAGLVLSALTPLQSHAAENTWLNTSGDFKWNNDGSNGEGLNWASPTLWVDGDDAVFDATGVGTVTLTTTVAVHNLTVGAAGYDIATANGSALTLTGNTPTLTANADVKIAVSLRGAAGLTLQGVSALTLGGQNTYTGATYLAGGTLVMKAPTGVNGTSLYALENIEALDAGATLKFFSDVPVEPLTKDSLVRVPNGQMGNKRHLIMSGGTFDLNGDDNQNQVPVVDGTGVVTNNSPYARAVLKMGAVSGTTHEFSGVIQDGGPVINSIVPNSAAGVTPVTYKQGYRTDIDLQSFEDATATLILSGLNTYTGTTRIGGGKLMFKGVGRWGVPTNTGDANTSTPNGSVLCNGDPTNLRVDFNGTNQITGGLSGSGGVYANNAAGTVSTLTVGAANISNSAWPTGGGGQNGKIVDDATVSGASISAINTGAGGKVALTKTGTGTIGFPTAGNSYSGPTLINDGILEFTAMGAPSPNSDHQINSPGVLKLSYSDTKNVNGLYLNGVKQAAGVYDAGSSPGLITGTGSITVTAGNPTFVPRLSATTVNGSPVIVWVGVGMLQESSDMIHWSDLPGVSSPFTPSPLAAQKFYRVQY
jgi:autotransporter-associated beta strand protein